MKKIVNRRILYDCHNSGGSNNLSTISTFWPKTLMASAPPINSTNQEMDKIFIKKPSELSESSVVTNIRIAVLNG
jgi:hypothetical protein